jgi:hypothetical protein
MFLNGSKPININDSDYSARLDLKINKMTGILALRRPGK